MAVETYMINSREVNIPQVEYSYWLDGKEFNSKRISFFGVRSFKGTDDARALCDSFEYVWYCPWNEQVSYVYVESRVVYGLPVLLCIAFLMLYFIS